MIAHSIRFGSAWSRQCALWFALSCGLCHGVEPGTDLPAGTSPVQLIFAQSPHADGLTDARGAPSAHEAVAVVYPDITEPYLSVFTQIIQGIEEVVGRQVRSHAVGLDVDAQALADRLRREQARAVIALGRQGLRAVAQVDPGISVVVGGVLFVPEAEQKMLTGISLTPDPALLFARLRRLKPEVTRVHVVYDPKHNEWLMRLARDAAARLGLELATHRAGDLGRAARLYEDLFDTVDSRREALWLPQDPTTVDENAILPLVLRESWNRNVAVFSSSYVHVKKGVLFVLYPDNVELGRHLGAAALKSLAGGPSRGIAPLRQVQAAVNLRTASHIGLTLSSQQQRSFDSVFPGQ